MALLRCCDQWHHSTKVFSIPMMQWIFSAPLVIRLLTLITVRPGNVTLKEVFHKLWSGQIFLKTSVPHPLKEDLLIPFSARSLSLVSTFNGVGRFSPILSQLTPLSRLTPVTSISLCPMESAVSFMASVHRWWCLEFRNLRNLESVHRGWCLEFRCVRACGLWREKDWFLLWWISP